VLLQYAAVCCCSVFLQCLRESAVGSRARHLQQMHLALCNVLQCVAVRCSALQSIAVLCCSALQYVLQCVAVRCSALIPCGVAVWCSVFVQCVVAVCCCSVLLQCLREIAVEVHVFLL